MAAFKDIAAILNHYQVGVYPRKDGSGKYTINFVDADGKRKFLDRRPVEREDGSEYWKWVVGRELQELVADADTKEISVEA